MTNNPDNIGVLVLAAGFSRRFHGDKRKARLSSGQTLLQATLASVPQTFSKRTVVLRRDDNLADEIDNQWTVIFAENPEEGMSASLAAGIESCHDWSGALIALGDMPFITSTTWEAVRTALCSHDIVQPLFQGKPGHPVGFNSEFFSGIAALSGDEGARQILKQAAGRVFRLDCPDEGILRDIDTLQDL